MRDFYLPVCLRNTSARRFSLQRCYRHLQIKGFTSEIFLHHFSKPPGKRKDRKLLNG